MNSLTKTET